MVALMQQEDGLIPKLIEKMEIQKQHFADNARRKLEARVKVSGGQVYVGQNLNKVLIHAEDEAKQMGDEYVSVEHLFLALIKYPNQAMKELFKEYGITRERFLQSLSTVRGNQRVTSDNPEATYDTLEKYGYDMAVLAGDKLFIYAFETAAKAFALTDRADLVGKAISILANKAGIYGMIGGQSVDVEYTDRPVTKSQLEFIYELKTAALLEAAMMIGAVLAGADDNQVKAAEQIAHHVGMAFQIRDDILDVISTTEELGKPVKSDEKNNKTTYVTIYGIDGASKLVEEYSHTAMTLLDQVCPNASFLKRLFEYLIVRKK